jgi:hypothetical protein
MAPVCSSGLRYPTTLTPSPASIRRPARPATGDSFLTRYSPNPVAAVRRRLILSERMHDSQYCPVRRSSRSHDRLCLTWATPRPARSHPHGRPVAADTCQPQPLAPRHWQRVASGLHRGLAIRVHHHRPSRCLGEESPRPRVLRPSRLATQQPTATGTHRLRLPAAIPHDRTMKRYTDALMTWKPVIDLPGCCSAVRSSCRRLTSP